MKLQGFLYSQALHQFLQALQPHLPLVVPVVQGVQTPAAQQSRLQVEPPQLQVREDQVALEAPEPLVHLYCRGIRSRNYPGEDEENIFYITIYDVIIIKSVNCSSF